MKVFQTYEKIFAYAIVRPGIANTRFKKLINHSKVLFVNFISMYAWSCLLVFFSYNVQTFREYSETIYALSTIATTMFCVKIYDWKKMELFRLVDNFGDVIETRKMILLFFLFLFE